MTTRRSWPATLPLAGVSAGILTVLAPSAWLVLPYEGLLAFVVIAGAAGWGAWPTVWLGLGRRGVTQQVCVGTALGLGVLSILTLLLGVCGGLTWATAWALVGIGGMLGITRLAVRKEVGRPRPTGGSGGTGPRIVAAGLLMLVLALPLAIMLFGASVPPGVLWLGENKAYDVLEYHLQGPREYYEAGRIEFLPHNVYTSFPQQMETLYLLLMHLAGGALAGAIPAQFLHALCTLLAVVALAAWAPAGWPRIVAAIVGGSVPWLAYLGCLAYVEGGMLLFAAVAGGLVQDHFRDSARCDWRTALAAGLCAGLAGGCKYTALGLVVAGLALAWLVSMRGGFSARLKRLAVLVGGATIAFSPWLIRNAVFTGNPVYPFGYRWFGGAAWSAAQDEQWSRGHRLPDEEAHVGRRLGIVREDLLLSPMFGPTLVLLAVGGLALRRERSAVIWALWAALMLVGWATLTRMPGRFLVPVVVPLAMLAAQTVGGGGQEIEPGGRYRGQRRLARTLFIVVAVLGAVANNVTLADRLRKNDRFWARHGASLRDLAGQIDLIRRVEPLNQMLPSDAKAWLIGDAKVFYLKPEVHYCVAFNRDPWLAYAAHAAPVDAVEWLRTQNVSHVVFSWPEIERLRATYGFAPLVTPAWVGRLREAGLRRVAPPAHVAVERIEVYEVAPPHASD